MRHLNSIIAAVTVSLLSAGCLVGQEEDAQFDGEIMLPSFSSLVAGAPDPKSLPGEGKADQVFPATYTELLADQSPIRNQGARGTCAVFSTVSVLESQLRRDGIEAEPDLSEQHGVWLAKTGPNANLKDDGNAPLDVVAAIRENGIVAESKWQYQDLGWYAPSTPHCVVDARGNRPLDCLAAGTPPDLSASQRFFVGQSRSLSPDRRSIKNYLMTKHSAVVASTPVVWHSWSMAGGFTLSERTKKGIITTPLAAELASGNASGHAMTIVGWDDNLTIERVDHNGRATGEFDTGFWIVRNSWGTQRWGKDNPHGAGYGFLAMAFVESYSYIDTLERSDVRVSTIDVASQASKQLVDNGQITDWLRVSSTKRIGAGATITLQITHQKAAELRVYINHNGKRQELLSLNAASNTISATMPLTQFIGSEANGDWGLQIVDVSAGHTGTLQGWSLALPQE